ncbi:MAG: hypothetical protein V2I37_05145 [Marinilabiliaceae bacterium]|jgi:hypothetical protein|nr:hypothetical protein [Marinilabiliaceae bacterium]
MRKGLKIKAFTLMVSWMIIFLHAVVPHHHDNDTAAAYESHNCSHSCADSGINGLTGDLSPVFAAGPDHDHSSEACHFNPNLFSNFNIDSGFISAGKTELTFKQELQQVSRPDVRPRLKKPPLLSSSALRAPPAA